MIRDPSPETLELVDQVGRAFEPAVLRARETADWLLWEAVAETGALVNGNNRRGIPWTCEAAWQDRLRFVLRRLRGESDA